MRQSNGEERLQHRCIESRPRRVGKDPSALDPHFGVDETVGMDSREPLGQGDGKDSECGLLRKR